MSIPPGRLSPYHVVPGPSAPKRILLISYHAAPSNEVGALRWAGMARYFAERGWGFDILAAEPGTLARRNDELFGNLPSGTRLFGIPHVQPGLDRLVDYLLRWRKRIRPPVTGRKRPVEVEGAGPVPRTRGRWDGLSNAFHAWRMYAVEGAWARKAAVAGRKVFDPEVHHWIISSGPPHMTHEGGRLLAIWTGLPLITDFRDAWRFQEWVPLGPLWRRLAVRYETRVVRRSAIVVANVEPVRVLMQQAYPMARVVTITNGTDDEPAPPSVHGRKFIIGYPGTIYVGRDPSPLFTAVSALVRNHKLTPDDIGIEFMGHSGPEVERRLQQLAADHGLVGFLTIRPGGPRARALEFMATCSVLVAFQQGSDLAVPAKVFEYMKFSAWLMVLAGPRSATAELLRGSGADVVDPSDATELRRMLATRYQSFREGNRPSPLADQPRYSRRFQAERLLGEMEATQTSRDRQGASRQTTDR
jgi:hypothetical protein